MPFQPTRYPYGISYGRPGANTTLTTATQYTLQNSSNTVFATPNVDYGTVWLAANSGLITNFSSVLGDEYGRLIYIKATTNNVILQNSVGGITFNNIIGTTSAGSTISFTTAGNLTMLNNEMLEFMNDGTSWCLVGNRFALSTQA